MSVTVTKKQISAIIDYITNNPKTAVMRYHFSCWGKHDPYLSQFIYSLNLLNLDKAELNSLVDCIFSGSALGGEVASNEATLTSSEGGLSRASGSEGDASMDKVMRPLKQVLNRFSRANKGKVFVHHLKHGNIDDKFIGQNFSEKRGNYALYEGGDTDGKKHQRAKRQRLTWFSRVITLVVALGEAVVAAVLGATLGAPLLPAFLMIGIPAFLINFVLFRGHSYWSLKEIFVDGFLTRLFRDENNELIKGFSLKMMLVCALVTSLAAGLGFGLLSFHTALTGFGSLLFKLSAAAALGAPGVGLIVIASTIAVVSACALFALFFCAVAQAIKTNAWGRFKNYLYKNTIGLDWGNQPVKSFVSMLAELVKVSVILVLSVCVAVASFALYGSKALDIGLRFFHMANSAAHLLSTLVVACAEPVNVFFQVNSIITGINISQNWASFAVKKVAGGIRSCFSAIANFFCRRDKKSNAEAEAEKSEHLPSSGDQRLSAGEATLTSAEAPADKKKSVNAVRWWHGVFNQASLLGMYYCIFKNGSGQAAGATIPAAVQATSTVASAVGLHLSNPVVTHLNSAAMASSSNGANTEAAQEVTILREVTDRCQLSQNPHGLMAASRNNQSDNDDASNPEIGVDDFVKNSWKALARIRVAS